MHRQLTVSKEDAGGRLDRFLAQSFPEYSRTYFSRLIENGNVKVNGSSETRCRRAIKIGNRIDVDFPPPSPSGIQPEDLPLDILFEDECLAVLVKPAGMTVHPGAGRRNGTLASALIYHFSTLSRKHSERPGIVHRLDRNTSGLMVVAKSERVHRKLAAQFQRREVEKHYLALVFGAKLDLHGEIDAPIGRHPWHRTRMAVTRNGRPSLTLYDVVERFSDFTFLRVNLKSGRTHQIRVHLAHINHPVVGDPVYGRGRLHTLRNAQLQTRLGQLNRLFLHATLLRFFHPRTGEALQFESPLPEDLQLHLDFIRAQDRVLE